MKIMTIGSLYHVTIATIQPIEFSLNLRSVDHSAEGTQKSYFTFYWTLFVYKLECKAFQSASLKRRSCPMYQLAGLKRNPLCSQYLCLHYPKFSQISDKQIDLLFSTRSEQIGETYPLNFFVLQVKNEIRCAPKMSIPAR